MQELIKIDFSDNTPVVSARTLHEYLEVDTDFSHWFPRMCEYGFTEGVDFNSVKIDRVQNEGGRLVTRKVSDAALTYAFPYYVSKRIYTYSSYGCQFPKFLIFNIAESICTLISCSSSIDLVNIFALHIKIPFDFWRIAL
jgi:hypothetical protein